MNETRDLARFLAGLRFSDLPDDVVDYTKRFLLDDVGCMLGGALQLGNKSLMRHVLAQGEREESTIVVYGHKTSAPSAALMNGAFICGWDYDNMTQGGAHMASQTAAMFAMAERELIDGEEMLVAECAGIEAQARIGIATAGVGERHTHPWHSNTTLGPFAAAVTTGKILGFDAETMEDAIAIVTHNMGGNYQHYFGWGSNVKRIRAGIGAWSGVRAALLAREGLTGPEEALEGGEGYLEAMHGKADDGTPWFDASLITEGLGEKWYTLTHNTKGFGAPCVTGLQTPCVTSLALKQKYDIRHEDIESVMVEHCVIGGLVQADTILGTMMGETPEQRLGSAGWCRRWMVALCFVLGEGGIRAQLNNIRPYGRYREIEELSEKVEARVNEEYYREHFKDRPYPNTYGGRIIVTLKDGRTLEHEPLRYLGCRMSDGTVNTATFEQLVEKMREQATPAGISRAKQARIVEVITHMEDQNDILSLILNLTR